MALVLRATPVTFVVHVLAVVCAVMVLVWCSSFRGGLAWEAPNKSLIFNIHPVLMLIGLIIIGGEGIISYKALPLKKEVKKVIHLVFHAVALILGIVGIWAAFKFHNESSIPNLYSLHSWLGIGIIVLYGAQPAIGFLEKLTFLEMGGLDKYGSEAYLVNFTAIATILYGTFVLLTVYAKNDQEVVDHGYSAVDSYYAIPY
ncbi:Transmembrane ascorbate ferrireductase 1 [Bienertia sinuspersici]